MKKILRLLPVLLTVLLLCQCGYRNPNVYTGPPKTIYLKEWKNRTNELRLDSSIYRSLTMWFQKSGAITTTREKSGADLILAGEIISIELPTLSYSKKRVAQTVKVRLRVRYVVKDLKTNEILLENANELWVEDYIVSSSSTVTTDNENEALDTIVEELSQKIYQRTILELHNS